MHGNRDLGRLATAADVMWHPELQLMAPLFEPSRVAHRRGVAERAGRWRDGAGLEDWDLWLRIADSGIGFRTVAEPTVTLTVDPTTRRHRTARRHILPLAEFTVPRRQAPPGTPCVTPHTTTTCGRPAWPTPGSG